jgi:hypothetical protein
MEAGYPNDSDRSPSPRYGTCSATGRCGLLLRHRSDFVGRVAALCGHAAQAGPAGWWRGPRHFHIYVYTLYVKRITFKKF